jgi:hypothetical protein
MNKTIKLFGITTLVVVMAFTFAKVGCNTPLFMFFGDICYVDK